MINKHIMNKKLFFGVVSFLIIVAGGILIWQFWPELHSVFTSDKTNG
jgi:ABC-type polysaccharide/polyol phosphate export permease